VEDRELISNQKGKLGDRRFKAEKKKMETQQQHK